MKRIKCCHVLLESKENLDVIIGLQCDIWMSRIRLFDDRKSPKHSLLMNAEDAWPPFCKASLYSVDRYYSCVCVCLFSSAHCNLPSLIFMSCRPLAFQRAGNLVGIVCVTSAGWASWPDCAPWEELWPPFWWMGNSSRIYFDFWDSTITHFQMCIIFHLKIDGGRGELRWWNSTRINTRNTWKSLCCKIDEWLENTIFLLQSFW